MHNQSVKQSCITLPQVPRNDFLIDKALAAELAAAADAKVAAAREEVRRAQVEVEVVAERVRTMCWDSLEQTGESISGMRVPDLFVPNFPMAKVGWEAGIHRCCLTRGFVAVRTECA